MANARRSNAYWARRAEQQLDKAFKTSAKYEKLVSKVYTEAGLNVTRQVQALYRNAYKKDEGFDIAKLNAIEPQGNIARFMATMERQGLATALPANYKGRLTRLQMLDAQIWAEVKKAGLKETALNTQAYSKILKDGYKGGQQVIAEGIKTSFSFGKMPAKTVERVLGAKFEGANYSERIWGQTDVLAKELHEKLATAIAVGQSYEKTAREFRQRFNVKQSYAMRLIRTETCYFETEAKLQAYKDMGIEEIVFVATLDNRTSDICQHADGQRIKISEARVGDNIPPLHPNCRSCIRAYIGADYEPTERIARGSDNKNAVTKHTNYENWRNIANNTAIDATAGFIKENTIVASSTNVKYNEKALSAVDSQLLAENKQQLESLYAEYDQVANWVAERSELTDSDWLTAKSLSMRINAITQVSNGVITLNKNVYRNRDTFIASQKRAIALGWSQKVAEKYYPIRTITHEFGHVVESYIMRNTRVKIMPTLSVKAILDNRAYKATTRNIQERLYVKALNIIGENVTIDDLRKRNVRRSIEDLRTKYISDYGKTKPCEFFAEAFVAYKLGDKGNVFGKAMGELLKEEGLVK